MSLLLKTKRGLQSTPRLVQRRIASGFDGISLFGEVSPFHAGAELNYLALADYGGADNLDL